MSRHSSSCNGYTIASPLIFLGAVFARQGQYVEAKQCYRQAIQLATGTLNEAYYNLGMILCAEKKYQKALKCFECTISDDPHYKLAKEAQADVFYLLELKGNQNAFNEIF